MSAAWEHVVGCVDRSEATARVVAEARRLRAPDGRLTLLHVAPPETVLRGGLTEWEVDERDPLAPPRAWLESVRAGVEGAAAVLLSDARPAEAAARWARDNGASLLVAAAHRGALARALLGSFTRGLVDLAPCDVMVVRPAGAGAGDRDARAEPLRHVACCLDDREAGRAAVAATARIAAATGARVSVVHAVAPPAGTPRRLVARLLPMPRARRRRALRWLRRHAARLGGAEPVLLAGSPGPAVREWAERAGVDLLVLGPRSGRRPGLGGVASHLVAEAPCPVLLTGRSPTA